MKGKKRIRPTRVSSRSRFKRRVTPTFLRQNRVGEAESLLARARRELIAKGMAKGSGVGKAIKAGKNVKKMQCAGPKVVVKSYTVPGHVRCKKTTKFTPKGKKVVKLNTMADLKKVSEKPQKGVTYQVSAKLSNEAYKQVGKSTALEDKIKELEKRYGSSKPPAPGIPPPP
jgi:hypothetical protein